MSKNKFLVHIKPICVIAIALVLFSCTPRGVNLDTLNPNLYDQSWLTGEPCSAPCWYGLEPGVSSRQDSISTTQKLPFISGINSTYTNSQNAAFFCKKPQDYECVNMDFENDVLEAIYFNPNYQITFEQVVERLGTPDGFLIQAMYPDAEGCKLQVVWKNKRLILLYETGVISMFSFSHALADDLCGNFGKQPLPKGILIQRVEIMLPRDIASLIRDYPPSPWEGFTGK